MRRLVPGYQGQLIRTILKSTSRLFKTRNHVRSRLDKDIYIFFPLSVTRPPPQPSYRRLSYVVFVVGTTGDFIRGVQNVVSLFQAFRSWGTQAVLHYLNAWTAKTLSASHKKRQSPSFIAYGKGGRRERKIKCPILSLAPHCLFRSAAADSSLLKNSRSVLPL